MPARITCCISADAYFPAIYRFLLKKSGNDRTAPNHLRELLEDYTHAGGQLGLGNPSGASGCKLVDMYINT